MHVPMVAFAPSMPWIGPGSVRPAITAILPGVPPRVNRQHTLPGLHMSGSARPDAGRQAEAGEAATRMVVGPDYRWRPETWLLVSEPGFLGASRYFPRYSTPNPYKTNTSLNCRFSTGTSRRRRRTTYK